MTNAIMTNERQSAKDENTSSHIAAITTAKPIRHSVIRHSSFHVTLCAMILLASLTWAGTPVERSLAEAAQQFDLQLRAQVLPYWFDQGQDPQFGGYSLEAGSKQLVSQTRMIWGFSHAHRHGFSTAQRNYLQAARQGYEFLQRHFRDQQEGGYFWMTDESGSPTNRYKMIYGQAFVIYALVEYYRASQDMAALTAALEQFLVLQSKARDGQHGGWFEHFAPDWTPVMTGEEHVSVEVPGYKSANAHLHLMEAFSELYLELSDDRVRDALRESLRINRTHFYPRDPAQCAFHCQPDWSRVTDPTSGGLSYGHNVEFAWLMLRAERALDQSLSWDHFYAHLDHALKYGFDHQRGGLYTKGFENQPAFDREKVWWSQAELLAALSVSMQHQTRIGDLEACAKLVGFLKHAMIDPQDGIWVASVAPDGTPQGNAKKSHWKANYHDVRAIVMFGQAMFPRERERVD
ncbi:MAG: AGE family epimerase/isomerase [Pirellulaceae bacterium]